MSSKIIMTARALVTATFITLAMPSFSLAGDWTITPEISLTETYDDNLMFKDISDFEHRITPALRAQMKSERSRLDIGARADVIRLYEYDEFNRDNQNYFIGGEYDLTERLTLKMGGRFRVDYAFDTELEESGIVADKSRRTQFHVLPGVTCLIDEKNRINMDLWYTQRDNKAEDKADFWTTGGNVFWSRMLRDERTSILAGIGVEHVDFDYKASQGQHTVYSLSTGFNWDLNQRISMSIKAGPSWTVSRFERQGERKSKDEPGFMLDSGLNWKIMEKTALVVGYNHGQYQSIYAENNIRDRFHAGLSHRLTERLSMSLDGTYIHTRTQGLVRREKVHSWQAGLSASYNIRENVLFTMGYRYRENRDRILKTREDGNRVYVQLTFRFPKTI
ncbi:outer membrane beta-barrel protein [Desulfonatronovibrio magnus]|uniref:outer membrane beta-barrel protein n=1 Tax=Desulfonatronovibrio magnus TaxID=698827 RepID=UPI0005EBC4A0|nr:outer membrane beta-barrel protein [Desulfonatronovibrio magnus]